MPNVYVVLARIPAQGLERFLRYEAEVLPLLPGHGGRLERRLRSEDGLTEVHLVSFPSSDAFARFRRDPRRLAHEAELAASRASIEVLELHDVP